MPAIITSKFRRNNAQQFEESFGEATPNIYYLGIGKPTAYGTKTRQMVEQKTLEQIVLQ